MGSIYTQALLSELMSERRSRVSEAKQQRAARARLLTDPKKIDDIAARVAATLSPSTKIAKKGKYFLATDALDSTLNEANPLKGIAGEIRQKLTKVLQDPRSVTVDPIQLANEVAMHSLKSPGKSGAPRLIEAYEHKRREDAEWFWGDEVNAPAMPQGLDYNTWLKGIQKIEEGIYGKFKGSDLLPDADELAIGAGAGAGIGLLSGGPPGAAIGAVGGLAAETVAKPFRYLYTRSENYRSKASPAMISNTWWDKTKGIGLSIVPDLLAGGIIEPKLLKLLRVPKMAREAVAASPTAQNILSIDDANKVFKESIKDKPFMAKMYQRITSDRGLKLGLNPEEMHWWKKTAQAAQAGDKQAINAMADFSKMESKEVRGQADIVSREVFNINDLDVGGLAKLSDVKQSGKWTDTFLKLDDVGQEEALRYADGVKEGVMYSYERMQRRRLATLYKEMGWGDKRIVKRTEAGMKKADVAARKVEDVLNRTTFSGKEFQARLTVGDEAASVRTAHRRAVTKSKHVVTAADSIAKGKGTKLVDEVDQIAVNNASLDEGIAGEVIKSTSRSAEDYAEVNIDAGRAAAEGKKLILKNKPKREAVDSVRGKKARDKIDLCLRFSIFEILLINCFESITLGRHFSFLGRSILSKCMFFFPKIYL